MSSYQQDHHDIGITNVGSAGTGTEVIGMMLAKTPEGAPAYEEYDSGFLAAQFFTGRPSQEYTNPEEEIILSQNDWRAGFGLEYADSKQPKRYFSSIGMDLRHKGQAIAGWNSTAITALPSYVTPTGHNDPDTVWNDETNAYDESTSTVAQRSSSIANGAWSEFLEFTIASHSIDGFRFNVGNNVASNSFAVDVDLYYGAAWNHFYQGSDATHNAWYAPTAIAAQTVTQARVRIQNNTGAGAVPYIYEVDFRLANSGNVKCFAKFNDNWYAAVGHSLCKLDTGAGATFTLVNTFDRDITWLEPFQVSGTDYLFICLGTSATYQYMTTAEAFTVSTAVVKTFQFMKWVNTTADTMYGNDGVNTIRSTTNPLNGGTAWSAQTVVGEAANSITQLYTRAGALYIGKEDMMYYLNSTGAVQRDYAPELTSALSSHSCKNADIWQDEFFIPAGDQALLRAKATNEFINPSKYGTGLTDFSGQVEAVAHDEEWLYIAVDNSTKVEILAGREEEIDGTTSWRWHPIHELTLTGVETIGVSTVYKKRLWISSTANTDSLYYLPLPTKYGDITADSNRSFKTGVTFETPWLHGDFGADDKAWIKLTLTLGHTYNAGRYFTVKYKKLGDTSWTTIGNYTGSATSMVQSRYIDTTNKPYTSMMKFQFTAVTDDTTITPILLNYDARAILYPSIRRLIHCVVRCAQDVVRLDGVVETNMYGIIKTTLDNARNNAVWPVSIRDIDGSTVNVKFLPVPRGLRRLLLTKKEKTRPKQEREYHLLMMEVALS